MIPLTRERCKEAHLRAGDVWFDRHPIQIGMGGDPWKVVLACQLLNRTRREQMEDVLAELLLRWPEPESLARAVGVEDVVRPCGLHRNRARLLTRFSSRWLGDGWEDLRELPGVGVYAADAVGLCVFGCIDLESQDKALHAYKELLCAGDAGSCA